MKLVEAAGGRGSCALYERSREGWLIQASVGTFGGELGAGRPLGVGGVSGVECLLAKCLTWSVVP